MKLIIYYRKRTSGKPGYGRNLEKQRQDVDLFVGERNATVIEEYIEAESGQMPERPQLAAAIESTRRHGAVLLIASGYRLRVNIHFLRMLLGVNFIVLGENPVTVANLPDVIRETEEWIDRNSRKIREAVKDATRSKPHHWLKRSSKERHESAMLAGQASGAAKRARADAAYQPILPLMKELRKKGHSFREIADILNEKGHLTMLGHPFTPPTVLRILKRNG